MYLNSKQLPTSVISGACGCPMVFDVSLHVCRDDFFLYPSNAMTSGESRRTRAETIGISKRRLLTVVLEVIRATLHKGLGSSNSIIFEPSILTVPLLFARTLLSTIPRCNCFRVILYDLRDSGCEICLRVIASFSKSLYPGSCEPKV